MIQARMSDYKAHEDKEKNKLTRTPRDSFLSPTMTEDLPTCLSCWADTASRPRFLLSKQWRKSALGNYRNHHPGDHGPLQSKCT